MNVCFCTHRLPYPPHSGGRAETYGLVTGLVDRGHDVTLVTYCDDADRARAMETAVGCAVRRVAGEPDRTPANLLANLVSRDPLAVMKARTTAYTEAVDSCRREADVVHLHALQTSFLAEHLDGDQPSVIRFNNVKSDIYRQYAGHTSNPAAAAYAYLQYVKTRRYEGSIPARSPLTLAITPEDRDRLRQYGASGRLDVLSAGIDTTAFAPAEPPTDAPRITFFGSMDYHPNEDAARWFGIDILPLVRDVVPDATFEILGKDPPVAIETLAADPGVTVTGFVEDIDEYIARASVIVMPIRVGTGIRMKALHAMAMGKPMVTTTTAIQGIDVEDGTHAAIADTAPAFATATAALLRNHGRQRRLGRNARALVERDHDRATVAAGLESYYEEVI